VSPAHTGIFAGAGRLASRPDPMAMRISTEMALQPKGIKDKSGINSDIVLRYPFAARYRKGLPPEPGDIPPVVNISGRHGFPDAMGCGFFSVLSPRLLEFIREANGPQWPLHACEITLVSKSIGKSSYMISRRREMSMDKSLSRPKPLEGGPKARLYKGLAIDDDRQPRSGTALISAARRVRWQARAMFGDDAAYSKQRRAINFIGYSSRYRRF
jgi:hypothetical protein